MDGTLVVHIIVLIIFLIAILACRIYCRKRKKHKALQFMIAGIYPTRVTPVMQSATQIRQNTIESNDYLPGTNNSYSSEPTVSTSNNIVMNEHEMQDDQISLESHVIPRTTDDIKSLPPPYSAGDLPTYEEAIGWSKSKYG